MALEVSKSALDPPTHYLGAKLMKLAGGEYALKPVVPMKSAKRGLTLCDLLRTKLVEYAGAADDALLAEIQTLWVEFCGIAFEKGETCPPVDGLDFHEVLSATQGFTQARSSLPK
jgi:hypothetical protein